MYVSTIVVFGVLIPETDLVNILKVFFPEIPKDIDKYLRIKNTYKPEEDENEEEVVEEIAEDAEEGEEEEVEEEEDKYEEVEEVTEYESYEEWFAENGGDVRIHSRYPYRIVEYNLASGYTGAFIVLDTVQLHVLKTADRVPMEFQVPSQEEIDVFLAFLSRYNISYPYSQYLTLSGG
jgi:hypothetical protein